MGRLGKLLSGLLGDRDSPIEFAGDPDLAILNQLSAAGADLSKPTHTLFYIYAPTEEAARRIAAAGADANLKADVRPSASGDGNWLCLLEGQLVPSEQAIQNYRSRFEALAVAEGGEYDGWEAAVTQ
jgi:hypothetical protein